jgi:hypothetical protein
MCSPSWGPPVEARDREVVLEVTLGLEGPGCVRRDVDREVEVAEHRRDVLDGHGVGGMNVYGARGPDGHVGRVEVVVIEDDALPAVKHGADARGEDEIRVRDYGRRQAVEALFGPLVNGAVADDLVSHRELFQGGLPITARSGGRHDHVVAMRAVGDLDRRHVVRLAGITGKLSNLAVLDVLPRLDIGANRVELEAVSGDGQGLGTDDGRGRARLDRRRRRLCRFGRFGGGTRRRRTSGSDGDDAEERTDPEGSSHSATANRFPETPRGA